MRFESRVIWAAVGLLGAAVIATFAVIAIGSIPDRRRMTAIASAAGLLVLHISGHLAYLIYA